MLNLGGMENSSPKTDQTPERFRVARNVKPTVEGVISPRNSFTTPSGQPSGIKRYPLLTQYDSSIFKMGVNSSNIYDYYLQNTYVPRSSLQGGAISGGNDNTSLAVMSYRKNNTTYVMNPLSESSFFKYDGVEITGCGTPQPIVGAVQYTSNPGLITQWIKLYQYRVDFDENVPFSELVSFPVDTTAAVGLLSLRVDGNAPNVLNSAVRYEIYPNSVISPRRNTTDDLFFIKNTVAYNAGTNDITVNTLEDNITSANVGNYIFVSSNATISTSQVLWSATDTGYATLANIVALRIKSVSGANVVLDCVGAKLLIEGVGWQTFTVNGSLMVDGGLGINLGFRKILSVYQSPSQNGSYTKVWDIPALPESTTYGSISITLDLLTTTGVVLQNTYDIFSRKLCINTDYPFGGTFYGMTSYQDQILWWTDDLIFFSDPNLGGSVEHPSAGSFIRVGDSEFGSVVSVCGTSDYFIVSRERKNYIVNGNLATANYRVQDISDIEIGAWCNNGMINVKDSVIMINSLGVWQIQSGGRVTHLSKQIAKNFSTYQPSGSTSDVKFFLSGFNTLPIVLGQDVGLDITFDEYSEFLFFCQRSVVGTPILVMHTRTGEFYEWDGVSGALLTRGLAAINGDLYFGDVNGTSSVVKKENKSTFYSQDYANTYPIKLYTTWLTAGEPSLEKQLLQLKMFGYVYTSADKFKVVHFKDWDEVTKITNSAYLPDSSTQYSHLKRLNSDKVLAASVGIEISETNAWFELESVEVEFNPIQQGIKR
jgi:hypothetical protein